MIRFKRIPENIHQKMSLLNDHFLHDSNVVFAYLFGGMVKDRPSPLSDVDIAVYVKDTKKLDYLEMFGKIADILGTDEIDLVILNNAPLSLAGRILQGRKVLVDKEPFVRHIFESRILREFFDFAVKEKNILKRRYGIGG
jgi:predicted nucleotidyltransferase